MDRTRTENHLGKWLDYPEWQDVGSLGGERSLDELEDGDRPEEGEPDFGRRWAR